MAIRCAGFGFGAPTNEVLPASSSSWTKSADYGQAVTRLSSRLASSRFPALPGNPVSAVYGTIIVAERLAVDRSTRHSTSAMIESLAATLIAFWLAHAYPDLLGAVIGAASADPPASALRSSWRST